MQWTASIAAAAAGFAAGLLLAVPAWFLLVAATWSSIHGGMPEIALALLWVVAMAVPPAAGFLAARATHGWWSRRALAVKPPIAVTGGHSSAGPGEFLAAQNGRRMSASIRVNCPHCGCCLEPSREFADRSPFTVLECPIHGPFHFDSRTELRMGRPPQT